MDKRSRELRVESWKQEKDRTDNCAAERGAGLADRPARKELIWIVAHGSCYSLQRRSIKSFLDLRCNFESKVVQPLREVANILQKLIVEDHRWNSGAKTRRG